MGSVQSVRSLWDQEPNAWDGLPCQLQRQIYRGTNADRELAAERYTNAPGGYSHWLRTSPIGPQLVELVANLEFTFGATERGRSLVLKDIVKTIARYQAYRGNLLLMPIRPGLRIFQEDNHGMPGALVGVRFVFDNESAGVGANEWSPWLTGTWFTQQELNS
jgi:hypothetical protein